MRGILESVQGVGAIECPFYAFRDELVNEVVGVYSARETNLVEPFSGGYDSMTRRLVEGLKCFDRHYRRARAHFRKIEREQADRERRKLRARSGRG